MADYAAAMRKTGLTLAPEAGTQRLRDVVNKNNTEEDLLRAVAIAYERGWRHVKLYFMIGLPTETEADLEGIAALVDKVVAAGRRLGRREVHVSLSPFSPKPHTPFGWEAQDPVPALESKIRFLKDRIRHREVKLSWRDPRVSQLETALGRGGRELAAAVENAWRAGARFDAWSDQFKPDLWRRAFADAGADLDAYGPARDPSEPQPWDHLSKGLSRAFLLRERERALAAATTPDCAEAACSDCGLSERLPCRGRGTVRPPDAPDAPAVKRAMPRTEPPLRLRLAYRKGPEARLTSHLDVLRIFVRAFRRARIRLALSQGFHAHPRLSPGPPLPLGYTSQAEYLDVEVLDNVPAQFERVINAQLPRGLEVLRHAAVPERTPALDGAIGLAAYRVAWEGDPAPATLKPRVDAFLARNSVRVRREGKEADIRLSVVELSARPDGLHLTLRVGVPGAAKVREVTEALFETHEDPPAFPRVERTALLIEKTGQRLNPMEVLSHA
jgi:radical SAM-linked protein